jgi:hypothetical protein
VTYFGLALMLGGAAVLVMLRHELLCRGPRGPESGARAFSGRESRGPEPRAAGAADGPRRGARRSGGVTAPGRRPRRTAAARRRAAEVRALTAELQEQTRPLAFHPRAEARRVLQAARLAQARADAARQAEERAAAEALAAERAAQTWAGYGYSYGGALAQPSPSARRPSPRRAPAPSVDPHAYPAHHLQPVRLPSSRGALYASAAARAGRP